MSRVVATSESLADASGFQPLADASGFPNVGYGATAVYGFFYWCGFFGPPRGSSRSPAR